jgi:hypothetical protein
VYDYKTVSNYNELYIFYFSTYSQFTAKVIPHFTIIVTGNCTVAVLELS